MPKGCFLLLVLCPAGWYAFFSLQHAALLPDAHEETRLSIPLRFLDYPEYDGDLMRAEVKTETGEKWLLRYRFKNRDEKKRWQDVLGPGSVCRISGVKKTPGEPKNDNLFNYRLHLASQRIFFLFDAEAMSAGSCGHGRKTFPEWLKGIRKKGMETVKGHFSERAAPLVNALLFGDQGELDERTAGSYRKLGISHLLAISGLHVTILAGLFYFCLLRIGMVRERVRNLLLVLLPCYALLAGGSPSVVRAVMMAWTVLFLSRWRGQIHPMDSLGLSLILFLLANPFAVYHAGFQLSYLVTAGLLLSKGIILREEGFLRQNFAVSAVAFLVSLPAVLYHFYQVSLLSLWMNLLFVPLYTAALIPLSLFSLLLLLVLPGAGSLFAGLFSRLVEWTNATAEFFADRDRFVLVLGRPEGFVLICYFLSAVLFFGLLEKRGDWKRMAFCLLFPVFVHLFAVKYSFVGEVTMIDVGQGDSILIRLPLQKAVYLIDTGGVLRFPKEEWAERKNAYDPGEYIVVPYLKSKGIGTIDKLILTHGDADHIGSARTILEELRVKEVVVGKTANRKPMEKELMEAARRKGVKVTEAFQGTGWEKGGIPFYVLFPKPLAESGNDSSIVLFARIGGKDWLFTGDLGTEGENRLLTDYPKLKADVLKVGHHGSETSSSERFLKATGAKTALISAGENNRYGHPHQVVLDRLRKRRMAIYRTDVQGAITYRFFLGKGYFRTWKGDGGKTALDQAP
jgi:competence protein ComEC